MVAGGLGGLWGGIGSLAGPTLLHQHLLPPPTDAMKLSPASSLPVHRVVETPFPASLSVERASFYLGNRRRRKGVFTVGGPRHGGTRGWLWGKLQPPASPRDPAAGLDAPPAGKGQCWHQALCQTNVGV